jgi:hypothetical protein
MRQSAAWDWDAIASRYASPGGTADEYLTPQVFPVPVFVRLAQCDAALWASALTDTPICAVAAPHEAEHLLLARRRPGLCAARHCAACCEAQGVFLLFLECDLAPVFLDRSLPSVSVSTCIT